MTDQALRTLERSYYEAPDPATGIAYFRALERVGKATKKQSQTLALLETPPNQADLEFAFGLGWQPAVVVRHLCEGVEEAPTALAWLSDVTRWNAVQRLKAVQCARLYVGLKISAYFPGIVELAKGARSSELDEDTMFLLRRDVYYAADKALAMRQSDAPKQRDLYCECLFNLDHLSL